jgi:transcriptional regulator with XRE-family HTH domain
MGGIPPNCKRVAEISFRAKIVPDHPRNIVGPQLRRLRIERGLSQSAFAAECQRFGWDASRDILKHIESGARWVSDMELVLLAACLRVEMEALFPTRSQAVKLALSRLGGGTR